MLENDISDQIIRAAIEVHKTIGPGLLESAYSACLMRELALNDIQYESEVPIVISYKGHIVEHAYRLDLLVENKVIVELKAIDTLSNQHKAQLLTYLRLMKRKLGLLINFNEIVLKNGIKRVVNGL